MPDPYYLEGLKREPEDIRLNNAYGMLLLRRGDFAGAEKHFCTAIHRMTWRSPNPYDSEAYYNLGLSLFFQDRKEEAFDVFYKATWSNEQQEMSFHYLAAIETSRGSYEAALELIEKGLIKNWHNIKARGLKAMLLRKLGRNGEAREWIAENLKLDPFDYVSGYETVLLGDVPETFPEELKSLMREFHENYLLTARDYGEFGAYEEAAAILAHCPAAHPMIAYYRGYYLEKDGRKEEAAAEYARAEQCAPDCCFPNKLEDIAVLEAAIRTNPCGAKAYYYLGDLYYDKLQFEKAVKLWEESIRLDDGYPTVHRNLALAYYNKQNDPGKARVELERAFALDETDARVFLELDQLYKKLGVSFEQRLENYARHSDILAERDDLMLEYVTLLNLSGQHRRAYETIMSHVFRPWEGAEGRISGQYKIALTELARERPADMILYKGLASLKCGRQKAAYACFNKLMDYGERHLNDVMKDDFFAVSLPDFMIFEDDMNRKNRAHCHYLMGLANIGFGRMEEAAEQFEKGIAIDFNHQNCRIYRKMAEGGR